MSIRIEVAFAKFHFANDHAITTQSIAATIKTKRANLGSNLTIFNDNAFILTKIDRLDLYMSAFERDVCFAASLANML